jgi:hypothetical protein
VFSFPFASGRFYGDQADLHPGRQIRQSTMR